MRTHTVYVHFSKMYVSKKPLHYIHNLNYGNLVHIAVSEHFNSDIQRDTVNVNPGAAQTPGASPHVCARDFLSKCETYEKRNFK